MAAQFAVLFARVAHPLRQTVLMDPFDTARADARVEQLPVGRSLATAHPANVALRKIVHGCSAAHNITLC